MEGETSKKKVWDKVNNWETELALLRDIIAKTQFHATTKLGGEVFTFNGKNTIGIGVLKTILRFGFLMECS